MTNESDGRVDGRRDPSATGESVEDVPVLQRAPTDTNGLISIETSDATAWCPYEGTADYYTIRLEYLPDGHVVELMSFRDYLQTYRDVEIGHEGFAKQVFDDLITALDPEWLRLVVEAPPRYGLNVTLRHQTGPKPGPIREVAEGTSTGANQR